jgi:hypothetical protein
MMALKKKLKQTNAELKKWTEFNPQNWKGKMGRAFKVNQLTNKKRIIEEELYRKKNMIVIDHK